MDWPSARRILLVAFLVTDLALLALRYGPGEALVPTLGGVQSLSAVLVAPGLDLGAEPFTSSLSLPVLRVATYDPTILVLDALGELPPGRSVRGGVLYRVGGRKVLVAPDGTVWVEAQPPDRLPGAGPLERAAARLVQGFGLGVPLGAPSVVPTRDGTSVTFPETTRDGTPIAGAGVRVRFDARGRFVSLRLRLVTVLGLAGRPSGLVPGATAVLTWAESRSRGHPAVVRGVRLGYVLPAGAHGDGFLLPPAWIILTDGGVGAVDARTGEVLH